MNMSYFVEGTIVDVVGMKMIKGVMEVRKGENPYDSSQRRCERPDHHSRFD
jgi:hypothetical protein